MVKQVLEDARVRALRMKRLRHLRQLERVAEEDEVARGRAGGEGVGERQLAGLVDHEVVEWLSNGSGANSHVVPATSRYRSSGLSGVRRR